MNHVADQTQKLTTRSTCLSHKMAAAACLQCNNESSKEGWDK